MHTFTTYFILIILLIFSASLLVLRRWRNFTLDREWELYSRSMKIRGLEPSRTPEWERAAIRNNHARLVAGLLLIIIGVIYIALYVTILPINSFQY
jgi:hypothetical protein